MSKFLKTFDQVLNEKKLNILCNEINNIISKKNLDSYVIHLKGVLGAGKSTFVRYFLYSLGLKANVVIQSPTFSYINEYKIMNHWYAHCDFYRAPLDATMATELLEYRMFKGVLIEWADQIADAPAANILIEIINEGQDDLRRYLLYS